MTTFATFAQQSHSQSQEALVTQSHGPRVNSDISLLAVTKVQSTASLDKGNKSEICAEFVEKEQIVEEMKILTLREQTNPRDIKFGRVARKKPLVSKRNLVSRLKFAKQHVHKDLSFWQNVLWTDESKFNRFGSDGKQYVRRPQNQELSPRYTHKTWWWQCDSLGQFFMVWCGPVA